MGSASAPWGRSDAEDSYKVGGEVVKRAADVREKVREHMKRLAQTNSFSHEVHEGGEGPGSVLRISDGGEHD